MSMLRKNHTILGGMDVLGKVFGGFEVTLLTLGAGALLIALGVAKEASLGKTVIKLPTRRALRLVWGLCGLGLITSAFYIAEPRWAPVVVTERIWSGVGEQRAVQIVSDGDELYVLAVNGNVWRIEPSGEVLVDSGTHTDQIEIAGGVLYVLKTNGNVWSVLLHERVAGLKSPLKSPTVVSGDVDDEPGRLIREGGPDPEKNQSGPTFTFIDPGTNTKSIVAAGETLYVLKKENLENPENSGKIWRRIVPYEEASDRWVKKPWERIKTEQFVSEIATSGTVLYYLSDTGELRAVFPLPEAHPGPEAHSSPLEDHVNAALDKCGKASKFAVDGRKVYFQDEHGNAWVCVDGRRESIFQACQEESVCELDAVGGILYLLTSKDQIVRYAPGRKTRRFPEISKGVNSLRGLVATAQGAYAIDHNGSVWRFSESLRKQD